jgi:hypothetical protein
MKRTTNWALVKNVFAIVHTDQAPDAAEFSDTIEGYRRHYGQYDAVFITTRGGAPNARQRKQAAEFWQGRVLPPVVILTSSAMVRGVITALNWLSAQRLAAFAPTEFNAACRHLGLSWDAREAVRAATEHLFQTIEDSASATRRAGGGPARATSREGPPRI